jgi:type I restriction enzyme S subunit
MRVKLGDVAVESRETHKGSQKGLPIVGLEHIEPGNVNLAEWNMDSETTFSKMFRKGQVLFGRRRAYLKKAALAPCDGICSGDITVIAAKSDKLSPELLPFIIHNDRFFDFAIEKSAGSMSPRVKWGHLREFEFDLPPMDEQRRLAEVLWTFDNTKQAYKKLLKMTDELVKSRFVEMFGDPVTNPMGWEMRTFSECLKRIDSGSSYNCEPHSRRGNNPAILKLSAVTYGVYNPDENKELPASIPFDERIEVMPGDLLFSRKNTLEMVGMSAFVYNTPPKLMLPDLIFRLIAKGDCSRVYLWHLINHPAMRPSIQGLANGSAASMPNISKQRLMGLTIPLPPLSLQNRFADFVRQADKSKFELARTIDEIDAAYKALVRERLG